MTDATNDFYPIVPSVNAGDLIPIKPLTALEGGPDWFARAEQLGSGTSDVITWTPRIQINFDSTGIVHNIQTGNYIQIGKLIIASFVVSLLSKGANVGLVTLDGFPIASVSNLFTCAIAGGAFDASVNQALYGVINQDGFPQMVFLLSDGAGFQNLITNTNLTDISTFSASICYFID